jgi:hypothetical protein
MNQTRALRRARRVEQDEICRISAKEETEKITFIRLAFCKVITGHL